MRAPFRILLAAAVAAAALTAAGTAGAIISPCFNVALGASLDGQSISGTLKIFGFADQQDMLYADVDYLDSGGKTLFSGTVAVQSLDIKPGDSIAFALPSVSTDSDTLAFDPIFVSASELPSGAPGHLQALTELFGPLPDIAEIVVPCFDVAVAANVTFGLSPAP
jgi:hypothetical protein